MSTDDLVRIANARSAAHSGAARGLRLAAGLSLREVASDVGVTVSTVWRWEAGERRPRGAAAVRYADLLEALAHRNRPRRQRAGGDANELPAA